MRRTRKKTSSRQRAVAAPPQVLAPAAQAAVAQIPETARGEIEAAIDRIMNTSAHLWHGRHGVQTADGKWKAAPKVPKVANRPPSILKPGFFVPAAIALYRDLLFVYKQNPLLFGHLASWVMKESDWKDMKVALAALLLVQPLAMFRDVGEAMILTWDKSLGKRALNVKQVLRVAEFLDDDRISQLNREAGFCSPTRRQSFRGRWTQAAGRYLLIRERNPFLLDGLVKAGMRDYVIEIARKIGYRPETTAFFQRLRWEQDQTEGGHRTVAIGLKVEARKDGFEGLTEEQICARIRRDNLRYAEVVGRLPPSMGLTQAIMVSLLPQMSSRDIIIATPSLESMGLLQDPGVRRKWEAALKEATDQRALNIAKNVKSEDVRDKLEEAAGEAVQKAVKAAIPDDKLRVLFLIDISSSQQGAVELSQKLVPRILAGLGGDGGERLHVATFNTMGTVVPVRGLKPSAVTQLLGTLRAGGGTEHYRAVRAIYNTGVRQKADETLIVMVVGDEGGEAGSVLAKELGDCGFKPAALALFVNLTTYGRGRTVQETAAILRVPFSEMKLEEFDDPYHVTRALRRLLDAPTPASVAAASPAAPVQRRMGWIEQVMSTDLLVPPVVPPKLKRSQVV